MKSKRKSFC